MGKPPASPASPAEEAAELRQVIREGHELLKDMRDERRRLEKVRDDLFDGLPERVDRRIEQRLTESIEALSKTTKEAMDRAVAKVGESFSRLEALYTGTDRRTLRAGKPSLEDHITSRRGLARPRDGDV